MLHNKCYPTLSLCMIVKNEKDNLARCLASAKPWVDEMIVVDTGSDDNTIKIAEQYGAKVSTFTWCDDFATARNYSISLSNCEWILVLDADEILVVESANFKQQLNSDIAVIGYSLIWSGVGATNGSESESLHTIRLFRNMPDLKYIGLLHERIIYTGQTCNNIFQEIKQIKILHYGNATIGEVFAKIVNRDIPLLERARQKDGLSLKLLYCLAGMYRDTQALEKAEECYAEAFDRLFPYLVEGQPPEEFDFIPSLVFTLATQSLQNQDYETARLLCQRGLEWCPNYPPLNYITGMTLIALGFPLGAINYFNYCLQLGADHSYYKGEPFERDFITTNPSYGLGVALMQMKKFAEALSAFGQTLAFDPNCLDAKIKIEQIKEIVK